MTLEFKRYQGTCKDKWCDRTGLPWNDGLCDWCCDDYLNYDTGRYFRIGQDYEDEPAEEVECARCGNRKFTVGKGKYFTALRCDNCGWEACIHDG